MQINTKAFTLVEMLVAMAVSTIIIAATYASYDLVAKQYKKNIDVAEMHTSGRAVMQILERDIRMAGFEYRDTNAKLTYGAISNPLVIKDSGNKCCDEVTVIYDYFDEDTKKVERIRMRYWTEAYTSNKGTRYRLNKRRDILGKNNTILAKPILGSQDLMVDFIEDFQFDIEMTQGILSASDLWAMTFQLLRDIHAAQKIYKAKHGKYYTQWSCTRNYGRGGCFNKFGRNAAYSGVGKSDNDGVNAALFNKNNKVIEMRSHETRNIIPNWSVYTAKYGNNFVAYVTWQGAAGDYCSGETNGTPLLRTPPNHSTSPVHNNYRTNCNRRAWIDWNGQITGVQSNWWNNHPNGHGPFANSASPGTISSSVVGINLTLRTRNEYGKDRQFKKKDYHGGNFNFDKNDKYKRDTFSSTVTVRNPIL